MERNCKVLLVGGKEHIVKKWIDMIKNAQEFSCVDYGVIKNIVWDDGDEDWRVMVYFTTNVVKNKTYQVMNSVKANPITWL